MEGLQDLTSQEQIDVLFIGNNYTSSNGLPDMFERITRSGEYRVQAAMLAPGVLSIGILLIPVVSDYSNHDLASKAVQMTIWWYLGHIISAATFCISLLSLSSIENHLQKKSYRLPDFNKILMTIGAGLFAAGLGADGIGPIAVNISSSDPSLFFDGSGWWVSGTFMAATVFFSIGLVSMVGHTNIAKMVSGVWKSVTIISAFLFVIVPAIPSGWGLYGEAIASFGVFLPLGLSARRST